MIRLTADDTSIVLTDDQVRRAKFHLMEFIPATRIKVSRGPGVTIVVPGHSVGELAPAVLAAVEDAVGCSVSVSSDRTRHG